MESTVIVYHMKAKSTICFDGFMSAALLWRKYKNTALYLQGFYHERLPIESFVGKDVIFADFSYPAAYMDDIASVSKSLLVLDHHDTAKVLEDKPYATIDMSMCGCLLVWKHLYGQVDPPLAVRYIDDGDRFTLTMPNAREFLSTLSLEEKDFEAWANLLTLTKEKIDQYIETGHAILALNDLRTEELAAECFPITSRDSFQGSIPLYNLRCCSCYFTRRVRHFSRSESIFAGSFLPENFRPNASAHNSSGDLRA